MALKRKQRHTIYCFVYRFVDPLLVSAFFPLSSPHPLPAPSPSFIRISIQYFFLFAQFSRASTSSSPPPPHPALFLCPPLSVKFPPAPGAVESASSPSTGVGGGPRVIRVPRLLLLIMTLAGTALLALNMAIIACFVRRRAAQGSRGVSGEYVL